MLQLTQKDMRSYIQTRIESITSPVAYSYGYETKQTAYEKLLELHTLSVNFRIGMEDEIEKAMKPYQEHFKQEYEKNRKLYLRA